MVFIVGNITEHGLYTERHQTAPYHPHWEISQNMAYTLSGIRQHHTILTGRHHRRWPTHWAASDSSIPYSLEDITEHGLYTERHQTAPYHRHWKTSQNITEHDLHTEQHPTASWHLNWETSQNMTYTLRDIRQHHAILTGRHHRTWPTHWETSDSIMPS